MRHDYDFPPDWNALTDAEKSEWMTRERCRRMNKRIRSDELEKEMEDDVERAIRILKARGYEDIKDKR